VKTDHWFYGLFQSAPDLITLLLPGAGAGPAAPSLAANGSANALYRFDAPELKAVNHRLDGVLWPRYSETGTPERPVVLLEVQMHGKAGFKHRLAAQSFRFLQLHPQVQHLTVVVVVPHHLLRLGPSRMPQQLQAFLAGVHWLSLEHLGRQPGLHPLLGLLTLPVRPEAEIQAATQQILKLRPDLLSAVLPMLFERFSTLTPEEIMVIAGIPSDQLRHTRAAQDLIEEGRAAEAAAMTLRLLKRRCGPLNVATTALIQALPLVQLEALAEALLDFAGADDLTIWLAEHAG
jgi:predicted transposase YdaD